MATAGVAATALLSGYISGAPLTFSQGDQLI